MSRINVCLSCDDAYAKHAGVVIASILHNACADDEHAFYILDGGIDEATKNDFEKLKEIKNCEINFIKIDENMFEDYKAVKTHFYITLPTFYRLKLPTLLADANKVIYFDCLWIRSNDVFYPIYWISPVMFKSCLFNHCISFFV